MGKGLWAIDNACFMELQLVLPPLHRAFDRERMGGSEASSGLVG